MAQITLERQNLYKLIRMSKFFKVTLLFLSAFLLTSSTIWDSWNIAAGTPGFVPSNPSFASTPPTTGPYYIPWIRYKNSLVTIPGISFTTRRYQYMYILNTFMIDGTKCKIYCGLRSFLVLDANQNLVCRRDKSSNYWGNLNNYQQYCVPNTDFAANCQYMMLGQGIFTQPSQCNLAFSGSYANKGYDCCYQNAVTAPNPPANEVDFYATTSYQTLMFSEP